MILAETLETLRERGLVAGRAIRDVHLTPYFTVVELADGSVGAAMSYYGRPDDLRGLLPPTDHDPLLLGWLFDRPDARPVSDCGSDDRARLLRLSLRTAVLGALSAPCIRAGGDGTFVTADALPRDPFAGVRRAVVVGFGGYMDRLAAAPQVEHLHVCDLGYVARRDYMEGVAAGYRTNHPGKEITLSDGTDLERRIREADLLTVTGSALCNGTLEGILESARGGPVVIVQGQSASLHPGALFRREVRFVATTLKPPELARDAASDPSGQSLRRYLEGGLRWVYLLPAAHGRSSV